MPGTGDHLSRVGTPEGCHYQLISTNDALTSNSLLKMLSMSNSRSFSIYKHAGSVHPQKHR